MVDTTTIHHQGNHGSANRKRHHPGRNDLEFRRGKSRRRFAKEATSSVSAPQKSKPVCSVCNQVEDPKYKCPKCRDTYCSIQCCRQHKAHGCSVEKSNSEEASKVPTSRYLPQEELDRLASNSITSEVPPQNADDDDDDDMEEGWKMTKAMKEAMERSKWLKNELKDTGLRHIIRSITQASDLTRRNQSMTKQEEILDQTKLDYPRFKKFLDKLLVLTDVLERHGKDSEVDLDKWLEREGADEESCELVLKPISQPARNPMHGKRVTDTKSDCSSEASDTTSADDDDSSSVTSASSASDEVST